MVKLVQTLEMLPTCDLATQPMIQFHYSFALNRYAGTQVPCGKADLSSLIIFRDPTFFVFCAFISLRTFILTYHIKCTINMQCGDIRS